VYCVLLSAGHCVPVLTVIVRDEHGFTPLHWAAIAGYMNLVELLLVKGARMDITNMGGDTPLHSAVAHGRKDIIAKVIPPCCR